MTPDAIRSELATLRVSMERIAAGLTLQADTLSQHTAMLKALMLAAAPDDDGSPLRDALERIAVAVEQQNDTLQRIEAKLPAREGNGHA